MAVKARSAGGARLLTVVGLLDTSTYLELRNAVIKAALDEPTAVLVDVNGLDAPAPSAWSVFTSARWHVSVWPDIPILLVCGLASLTAQITESGVTHYVPAHSTVESALGSLKRP